MQEEVLSRIEHYSPQTVENCGQYFTLRETDATVSGTSWKPHLKKKVRSCFPPQKYNLFSIYVKNSNQWGSCGVRRNMCLGPPHIGMWSS